MNDFFRRQLSEYAGYHRDERNRLTHDFGIPIIFLAVVLPLSVWPVTLFGIPANAAIVVSMPVLIVLKGSGYEMMSALGHYAAQSSCPLYPQKRTCAVHRLMSALCQ
jgi:uncharacterized membrane protein YGL010W